MKIKYLFLVTLLFVPLVLISQDNGQQPFSADMTLTDAKGKVVAAGKYVVSPPKMRVDIARDPQHEVFIILVFDQAEKSFLSIDPRNRTYTKAIIESAPELDIFPQVARNFNPEDPCAGTASKCKHIKSEVIDGRPCEMWEIQTRGGTSRECIDQKLHYPILTRTHNGKTFKFSNIVEKQPDPSLFEPPPDYKNTLDEDKEKSKDTKKEK